MQTQHESGATLNWRDITEPIVDLPTMASTLREWARKRERPMFRGTQISLDIDKNHFILHSRISDSLEVNSLRELVHANNTSSKSS